MGNCQAAEAATVVIQHPGGKTERVYWSVAASQVMAANPGHYVALIITTLPSSSSASSSSIRSSSSSRSSTTAVKHLKLLRPDDTLRIGHTYRLVSFEEVLREFASTKRQVKLSRLLIKHKEKPASRRSSSSRDGSDGSSNSRGCKNRSSSTDGSGNDTTSSSRGCKNRSSSTDGSGNDATSSSSRCSKDRRSQVNDPESSLATDQAAESSIEPSSEKEAETDQELELAVRGMMGGGSDGMTAVLCRRHWRPTLQSIAEGSVGN